MPLSIKWPSSNGRGKCSVSPTSPTTNSHLKGWLGLQARASAREVERARLYGLEAFAKELLGVVDSVEMGLVAAEQAGVESLTEGNRATLKLALDMLKKFNISVVDPLGETFDPQHHEAMAVVPAADAPPDSVVQVVQKGYLLHDRLLRPARVMVAKGE